MLFFLMYEAVLVTSTNHNCAKWSQHMLTYGPPAHADLWSSSTGTFSVSVKKESDYCGSA